MHTFVPLRKGVAALALSFILVPSMAQTFAPTGAAQSFNVFVRNSVTAKSGDTHGPVAMGGNLVLNGSTVFVMNSNGRYPTGTLNAAANYGMVIGGRVTYTTGNQSYVNQGFLRLGDATGSRLWYTDNNGASTNLKLTRAGNNFNANPSLQLQRQQPSGSATQPHGLDFASAFETFMDFNFRISNWSNNMDPLLHKITIPGGANPHILLANDKINYINLSGAQLQALNSQGSIIFDNRPAANRVLVFNINVSGSFNWTPPNIAGLSESHGAHIIWNFYGATTLNLNGSNHIIGSVYAPGSAISFNNPNNLNGQVISQSLVAGGGEIHYYPFTCTLPDIEEVDAILLPLRSIELGATLSGGTVQLRWEVLDEEAIAHYSVERSTDGSRYEAAGTVNSTGDHSRYTYTFRDNIDGVAAGTVFYRIKVTENSGKTYYSRIYSVKLNGIKSSLEAWPNPVVNKLTISYKAEREGMAVIRLLHSNGQPVRSERVRFVPGPNQVMLQDLQTLPAGVYVLEILNEKNERIGLQKVVK